MENTQYPTRQRRVEIQFDSVEVVDGFGEFDGWFRGIDVNTAASAAAAAGDDDDEKDDDDDDDYFVSL